MKTEFNPFFANAATLETDDFVGLLVANEYAATDGNWIQLSPFGQFKNPAGLQIFNPTDASNICNEFDSVEGKLIHPTGIPFLKGHPDHPAFKSIHRDDAAKGRIKELECRAQDGCPKCAAFANETATVPCRSHGLFGKVKWNDEGKRIIANEEFHGHSTNWQMHREADGWHPHYLKSVGFTNEPVIPVPAITAANQKDKPMAKPSLIEHINSCLGTNYANEEDASAGMTDFANQYKAGKIQVGDLQGKLDAKTKEHGDLVGAMAEITKRFGANEKVDAAVAPLFANGAQQPDDLAVYLANELTTARASLAAFGTVEAANEKLKPFTIVVPAIDPLLFMANEIATARTRIAGLAKKASEGIAAILINGGFSTKPEAEALALDFANESKFDTAATGLIAMRPKYRVTSGLSGNLGDREAALKEGLNKAGENVNKFAMMVNQRVADNKTKKIKSPPGMLAYDHAYQQIANENAELFATMQQPVATK